MPIRVAEVFAINIGLAPVLSYILRAEVLATLIMRPPPAPKPERKVPFEDKRPTKLPVWLEPAVISTPEFVAACVVSTVKTELPEPS